MQHTLLGACRRHRTWAADAGESFCRSEAVTRFFCKTTFCGSEGEVLCTVTNSLNTFHTQAPFSPAPCLSSFAVAGALLGTLPSPPAPPPASYPGHFSSAPFLEGPPPPRAPTDAVRLAVPALARLSPTFEEPRIPLREMADELSAELAEAKKAFHTANTNWTADPGNFALKEVKLSADLVVKEIEFKIKEAEVKALVTQGKGEDDAQVKSAKEAMHHADWAVKEARLRADLVVKENEYKIKEAEVKALLDKNMGDDNAQVKEAKAAMLRADLAVKEIKYEICAAKVDALVTQGKGEDDAQVKEAKAARDDARDERSKASARLDEFTKSASTPRGASPPSRRSRIPLVTNT